MRYDKTRCNSICNITQLAFSTENRERVFPPRSQVSAKFDKKPSIVSKTGILPMSDLDYSIILLAIHIRQVQFAQRNNSTKRQTVEV